MQLLEKIHWIGGLAPDADRFDGDPDTDVFEVQGEGAVFILWMGTNAGTTYPAVTVEACDDTTPSNYTAVAFYYKASTTLDTWGDWTAATAAGFNAAGSSNNMYVIYVPASELASEGYGYVRLCTEETGGTDVIDAMVLAGVVNPRYAEVPESLID